MKAVIVGGVAGGASAAARLRRLDEHAEIVMLERSGYVSYANCGLPYYVGGIITQKSALTLQTPESFRSRFAIDVRTRQEAIAIDPEKHTVTVRRLEDGETYTETYDKLILSPGARPVAPDLPGIQSSRVFTLRTVEDTEQIRAFVQARRPKTALVVGGGYIGVEMAENLTHLGLKVTLAELSSQILAPLDYDMACGVQAYLREQGVELRLGAALQSLEETEWGLAAQFDGGETLSADMALLAVGVRPDTALAADAGLALGRSGAILVNESMQTSAPDIYAVGDAVQVRHFVSQQPTLLPLAGPANKQGRIAADNICGRSSVYRGTQGSSIVRVFGLTAAATGLNEKTAQAAGISYETVVLLSADHATYYPGAQNMTLKALFSPETGKLLGAQIVGFQGVDKRIDVLASAIRAGMDAADLAELELAYAPPYSSAKDPVNMAGFVMGNVLDGLVRQFHWHDVAGLPREAVTLLDVRTPAEFARGHIDGAINIPLDSLRRGTARLDADKPVYVNCHSGLRSYLACRLLTQRGFDCYNLSGGYQFYATVCNGQTDREPKHPCGVRIEWKQQSPAGQ